MSFMESILHVKLTSNERLGFPLREQYDKKETQFARLNTFFRRNLSYMSYAEFFMNPF